MIPPLYAGFLTAWALFFTLATVCPALAQEANSKKEPLTLETTVVTAQKREENVQDVPISMNVFNELQVDDAGMTDLSDLTLFAPNVYAKQSTNQNMIIMRGLASHNVVLNTPAGLFVDDIPYPLTFMQNPVLFDIERIEVLRGPQGTLYGNNTESGAIRIITHKPGNTPRGKIFFEPGIYDSSEHARWLYRTGASLSGPLVKDTLYMSGAILSIGSAGYMTNVYDDDDEAGDEQALSGQIKLRWTPTSRLDATLLLNGSRKDNGYGYYHYTEGPMATEQYHINWDGANHWVDENNGQALHVQYAADQAVITSISTRNDFDTQFENDGEFGPLPYPDQEFRFENTTYSQEFRVASPKDSGPFEWLGGVFLSHGENKVKAAFFYEYRDTSYESDNCAVFGQAAYKFFNKLKLTVGLRWDYYASDGDQDYTTPAGILSSFSKSTDNSELLPKVSLSYDLSDNIMTYASVAKGMLAGGYNYGFATGEDSLLFEPETTWNYELGVKSEWLHKTLKFNVTGFYIDIEDKQVEEYVNGASVRSVTNAARASSCGVEADLEYRPFTGWLFFGGGGYTNARIEEWTGGEIDGGTYDYADKKIPYAPEYTYNLGAEYMHESGYFGRVDLLGLGGFYSDAKNTIWVAPYEVVNLRVGRRMKSWDLSIWCKNLLNREYYKDKSTYINNDTMVVSGAPRSLGINVTYHF